MSRTERGLVRPVQTSRYSDYDLAVERSGGKWPDRTPVAVEKPPRLIEEVVVNPLAIGMLHPDFRYLATADYLREVVCLSVPLEKRGVLSPEYWGRAIPLGYGEIPYGHYIGGTVMGKGGYRSGKYYDRVMGIESTIDMPIGFFGAKDAAKEMEIGNALHDIGFRSSLVLGYAVLNSERTKEFLLNRWRERPEIAKDIEKCFAFLQAVQEKPSFLVRIAGVTSRIHVVRPSSLYRRAEIVRAMGLLSREAAGDLNSSERTLAVLQKMNKRERLDYREFGFLLSFYREIYERNHNVLELAKTHDVLRKYQALGVVLCAPKDNDPMLLALDFEEMKEGDVYGPEWGYWNFRKYLASWLRGEVGPGFVAEYNKDEGTALTNRIFEV